MRILLSFLSTGRMVRRPVFVMAVTALTWLVFGQPAQSEPPPAPDALPAPSGSTVPATVGPEARSEPKASISCLDAAAPASPSERVEKPWYRVGLQITVIQQIHGRFRSPYQGTNSLRNHHESEFSHTYTLYLGIRPTTRFELYLDPEMARGKGISQALGLAGFTNGDVIRNPTLGQSPYLARYMGRWTVPVGKGEEKVEDGELTIAGMQPAHRLVLTAGKMGTNDIFDVNRYANSTRTQFMNWALINSAAYDYAADTRGYSRGLALEWVHPSWALRLGSFQLPTVANGPDLAGDLQHNRGDQIEAEFDPHVLGAHHDRLKVRLLGYRNVAHMGRYGEALALARRTNTAPDITAVERRGAVKYGANLNFEQPLADDGNSGVFGRFGWNDDATESFAFTECARTCSLGAQLSGAHWRRPDDRWALALVQDELGAAHRDYLAAGGLGFQLGDGRLRYGPEQILESYYAYAVTKTVTLSLDYQFINHPGYNRDRGPVSVSSFRLHWEF